MQGDGRGQGVIFKMRVGSKAQQWPGESSQPVLLIQHNNKNDYSKKKIIINEGIVRKYHTSKITALTSHIDPKT